MSKSLAERLANKALEEIKTKGAELEATGEDRLQGLLDSARAQLPEGELGAAGERGIAVFEQHKSDLAGLTVWGVQSLAINLAAGDVDSALLLYMREEAGWDELHAEREADLNATAEDKRERERQKAAALSFLKDLGEAAISALPFLLKAIVPV